MSFVSETASVTLSVGLGAVVVAATPGEPRVLAVTRPGRPDALPAGPLESGHRTLETGLRSWVERLTGQALGYVEQLYTLSGRDRTDSIGAGADRALAVAYLALVREARAPGSNGAESGAAWRNWYGYFPWEDWRGGRPAALDAIEPRLLAWQSAGTTAAVRQARAERLGLTFGFACGSGGTGLAWSEERVLDRYELLYEAGLAAEAWHDRGEAPPAPQDLAPGAAMAHDHRRMLALAIGRLRGKLKYRPVIFELMPLAFTLSELQGTVEALAGVRLHKQNFRRLVESQGLVEETGETTQKTGGRPARLVRFRREVVLERLTPGVRLPLSRHVG